VPLKLDGPNNRTAIDFSGKIRTSNDGNVPNNALQNIFTRKFEENKCTQSDSKY
jgi:hypothetical protein